VVIREQADARKSPIVGRDALGVTAGVSRVVVAKGQRVTSFEMTKARPDDQTLLEHLLAPTGNLRAPAIRKGKTMVVGYHEAVFAELFG